MVRFAHVADCHLGSWRQQELQDLNFISFQRTVAKIIEEKVDFILISGDLFDSAYPPIKILKLAFGEFKKIKDAQIPVFIIAGSHDYSASGRTFLDVLEMAGFVRNVENIRKHEDGTLELIPTIHEGIALYGYPGRKSGLEIEDLHKVKFRGDEQHYKIFMLHTTISDVVSNIDMNSIEKEKLPHADYYALGHIHLRKHIEDSGKHFVYPGPTYPNNFQELVDLTQGSFVITEVTPHKTETTSVLIPSKEVAYLEVEIDNAHTATEEIIEKINKMNLKDKVFLLKVTGTLEKGKSGDIRFTEIEEFIKKKEVYTFLRNISHIKQKEFESSLNETKIGNVEEIERMIQQEFKSENPHDFNAHLPSLMNILSLEKSEEEKNESFENRLLSELKDTLQIDKIL